MNFHCLNELFSKCLQILIPQPQINFFFSITGTIFFSVVQNNFGTKYHCACVSKKVYLQDLVNFSSLTIAVDLGSNQLTKAFIFPISNVILFIKSQELVLYLMSFGEYFQALCHPLLLHNALQNGVKFFIRSHFKSF